MMNCRVCNGAFFPNPLLSYDHSPWSAQGFLNPNQAHIDDTVDLKIWQCQVCGTIQHNLLPVEYYREVIRAIAFSPGMRSYRVQQLNSWLDQYQLKNQRILEVGAGKGEYLDLLKECGAQNISGLEFSKNNCASARQNGHNIYQGYLDGDISPLPAKLNFQAFTVFSFMEHWPNPNLSFSMLNQHLSDGAIGLIEVPNFEMILQKGLYSEFTTDHIFYFDKKSLIFLLEKNGFEVLSIDIIWHDYILSAVVRKRQPLATDLFEQVRNRVTTDLHDYIARFDSKSVVVWGAGHQALAVITMTQIQNEIKYIVDSAKFKQEKLTPASHIIIKPPSYMNIDCPKAIIVMAAGYSNEVANLVVHDYPHIKHLAILREDHLEVVN